MKTIIFSIATLVISAACKPMPPDMDMEGDVDVVVRGCKMVSVPKSCKNLSGSDPSKPTVVFDTDKLTVMPPNVCADPGATVKFEITPAPTKKSTVLVIPKKFSDTWLSGNDKDAPAKINVLVPSGVAGDHDYSITTADGKCVDPRIHVR